MKQSYSQKLTILPLALLSLTMVSGVALAASVAKSTPASTATAAITPAANATATEQQHLATIKSRGDAEINRRLVSLGHLANLINSSTRLTAADKSALVTEVSTEQTGLQQLETQLNGETTLAAAITDAKSIYSEYRVYAFVTPKIRIVKTADDQQATETKLTSLSGKLQTRITADQAAGKNVANLQSQLGALNAQVAAAQAISTAMEQAVIGLQPSDYNDNHSVLSGDAAQLKTAHADNTTALADAKAIVSSLTSL